MTTADDLILKVIDSVNEIQETLISLRESIIDYQKFLDSEIKRLEGEINEQ